MGKWLQRIWRTIEVADTVGSWCQRIGLGFAVLTGAALAIWSAVEGLPGPVIVMLGLAGFGLVLFALLIVLQIIERLNRPKVEGLPVPSTTSGTTAALTSVQHMTPYEVIRYIVDESEWGRGLAAHKASGVVDDDDDKVELSSEMIALNAMTERLEIGKIYAHGIPTLEDNHKAISASYWRSACLHPLAALYPGKCSTCAKPDSGHPPLYDDVRFVPDEVRTAWPKQCEGRGSLKQPYDMSIWDAVTYLWRAKDSPFFNGEAEMMEQFRQAAADGRVTVWGRKYIGHVQRPLEEIPRNFWLQCDINWMRYIFSTETDAQDSKTNPDHDWETPAPDKFYDLRTSSEQVLALWPKSAGSGSYVTR